MRQANIQSFQLWLGIAAYGSPNLFFLVLPCLIFPNVIFWLTASSLRDLVTSHPFRIDVDNGSTNSFSTFTIDAGAIMVAALPVGFHMQKNRRAADL
jgi:hypothetical protein